jgi:nicotinamide mononucleotide adenylyltransferase
MTATDARRFDGFSVANTIAVESALNCTCEAYRDIFTYNRWKAQGFQVQRGQKSIRLPIFYSREVENKETGKVRTEKRRGSSAVFCRCQVRPVEVAS